MKPVGSEEEQCHWVQQNQFHPGRELGGVWGAPTLTTAVVHHHTQCHGCKGLRKGKSCRCEISAFVVQGGCEGKPSRQQLRGETCKWYCCSESSGAMGLILCREKRKGFPGSPQVCVQEGCSAPWGDCTVGRCSPAPSGLSGSTLHLQGAELGKVFPPLHVQK